MQAKKIKLIIKYLIKYLMKCVFSVFKFFFYILSGLLLVIIGFYSIINLLEIRSKPSEKQLDYFHNQVSNLQNGNTWIKTTASELTDFSWDSVCFYEYSVKFFSAESSIAFNLDPRGYYKKIYDEFDQFDLFADTDHLDDLLSLSSKCFSRNIQIILVKQKNRDYVEFFNADFDYLINDIKSSAYYFYREHIGITSHVEFSRSNTLNAFIQAYISGRIALYTRHKDHQWPFEFYYNNRPRIRDNSLYAPYEHRMRLWNDEVGKRIGNRIGRGTVRLAEEIIKELKNGGLVTDLKDQRLRDLYPEDPKLTLPPDNFSRRVLTVNEEIRIRNDIQGNSD